MGRPKKGNQLRKPMKKKKKNIHMPLMKRFDKPHAQSNSSSMSSEFDHEEGDEVFDHLAPQHQDIPTARDQMTDLMHPHTQEQHQSQPELQPPQQQQQGEFSLGSILHDCMTVDDWNHDGEMASSLEDAPSVAVSLTRRLPAEIKEEAASPHLRHNSSPMHADIMGMQQQQQQQQLQHRHQHQHHQHQHQQPQQPQQHSQQVVLHHQQQQEQVQIIDHINRDTQQPHHHHQQRQQQQQQQQSSGQLISFQNTQTSEEMKTPDPCTKRINIISGLDYGSDHHLPVNRPVKVEDLAFHEANPNVYTDRVELADMRSIQSLQKADFRNFQLHDMSPRPCLGVAEQQRSASVPTGTAAGVPISQLDPSVSSQIVGISVPSDSIIYTPHPPHESIIVQNMDNGSQQGQGIIQTQQVPLGQGRLDQGQLDQRMDSIHDEVRLDPRQTHHLEMLLQQAPLSEANCQPIINQNGIVYSNNFHHVVTSRPQSQENEAGDNSGSGVHPRQVVFNAMSDQVVIEQRHHQSPGVVSDVSMPGTTTSPSLNPRTSHSTLAQPVSGMAGMDDDVLSSGSHASRVGSSLMTMAATSHTDPSTTSVHVSLSGEGKSPIIAILEQHKDDIQAGRPVQLSSNEIEELLSTFHNEQARAFKNPDSDELSPKDMRNSNDHRAVIDARFQQGGGQYHGHRLSPHEERGNLAHTPTPPVTDNSIYQNSSPVEQNLDLRSQGQEPVYNNHISSAQRVPIEDVHQHNKCSHFSVNHIHNSSTIINNNTTTTNSNNNNINNNNTSRNEDDSRSHHISIYHASSSPSSDIPICLSTAAPQEDAHLDDNFNDTLVRDNALLHEINRIFLGIDNSCEHNGCHRRSYDHESTRDQDRNVMPQARLDEFSPESSHRYWHAFQASRESVDMNATRERVITEVLDAFDNLKRIYISEPEYTSRKSNQDRMENWHHTQRKIARHVVAGQRFCRNIPGYFKLDIQDRICLGKHMGFGLMVLIACSEFYDPSCKKFKYMWNFTMPIQNPMFSYKVHLLSLGELIHQLKVDRMEAAMLCAISMSSIDCPGLAKPDIVTVVRDSLIDALEAHISVTGDSSQRLPKLLSLMPQIRLMTLWYNNLMKKMSVPSEIVHDEMTKARLQEPDKKT